LALKSSSSSSSTFVNLSISSSSCTASSVNFHVSSFPSSPLPCPPSDLAPITNVRGPKEPTTSSTNFFNLNRNGQNGRRMTQRRRSSLGDEEMDTRFNFAKVTSSQFNLNHDACFEPITPVG
jgi:hypothetical protein